MRCLRRPGNFIRWKYTIILVMATCGILSIAFIAGVVNAQTVQDQLTHILIQQSTQEDTLAQHSNSIAQLYTQVQGLSSQYVNLDDRLSRIEDDVAWIKNLGGAAVFILMGQLAKMIFDLASRKPPRDGE